VNWFPWGDAAFERARTLGRPVLLSVGYSTCHWCHVMERESFEDEEIAAYINARFVAVKVDREERPDVDAVYMAAVNALTGRGGWPMTVVMTPERRPFFGGTYFPARDGDRPGQRGFLSILRQLSDEFDRDPAGIADRAAKVTEAVQKRMAGDAGGDGVPGPEALEAGARGFANRFDRTWGGFARQPKFPRPAGPAFLLRYHRRTGDAHALHMAVQTLRKMAEGGLWDHIGGGFHRYAVDARWLVPHFEKMLYDNAQLAVLYLEGSIAAQEPAFEGIARATLDYLEREMSDPLGGFHSATDADSATPDGQTEEGWFFTWTPAEIDAALPAEQARVVKAWYRIDAQAELDGRNVLHTPRTAASVAEALAVDVATLRRTVDAARPVLYAARAKRPPPLKDDKIVVAWNGLAVSAFARVGWGLGEDRYIERARRAAAFVLERVRGKDGRLRRTWNDGQARHHAVLEDYAFVVAGLLDLFEATAEQRWLDAALALQKQQDAHFSDDPSGGYFHTADDAEALLARAKDAYDGAEPSGNSIAALNLLRLAELTSDAAWARRADGLFTAFAQRIERSGLALPAMLSALDFRVDRTVEVVIAAPDGFPAAAAALEGVLRRTWLPNRVQIVGAAQSLAPLVPLVPVLEAKSAAGKRARAFVCEQGRCELPTSDPAVFARQLRKVRPLYADRAPTPLAP
jgi:uncharacterized protein YyaL (SSP411 family)